jgi:hypothetical protein
VTASQPSKPMLGQKIPTLFKRDLESMKHVTDEVVPGCEWVLAREGVATRKYDGTCTMLDEDGRWWARREVKPGKPRPDNFYEVLIEGALCTVGHRQEPLSDRDWAQRELNEKIEAAEDCGGGCGSAPLTNLMASSWSHPEARKQGGFGAQNPASVGERS